MKRTSRVRVELCHWHWEGAKKYWIIERAVFIEDAATDDNLQ